MTLHILSLIPSPSPPSRGEGSQNYCLRRIRPRWGAKLHWLRPRSLQFDVDRNIQSGSTAHLVGCLLLEGKMGNDRVALLDVESNKTAKRTRVIEFVQIRPLVLEIGMVAPATSITVPRGGDRRSNRHRPPLRNDRWCSRSSRSLLSPREAVPSARAYSRSRAVAVPKATPLAPG